MKSALLLLLSLAAAIASAAPIDIKIWRHETDDKEMKASAAAVERFNRGQSAWRIVTETLPQGSYQQAVVAAAMTNKLPCVLDLDQPTVPNFAWAGHIQPLEGPLQPAGADALIPGGRTRYKGKLYAVGTAYGWPRWLRPTPLTSSATSCAGSSARATPIRWTSTCS